MKVHFRVLTTTAAVALGASMAVAPLVSSTAPAVASARSSQVNAKVFTRTLKKVGEINLSAAAKAQHRTPVATIRQGAHIARLAARGHFRAVDNVLLRHRPKGRPTNLPHVATTGLSTNNVPGERGFSALTNVLQAGTDGGLDLEPPDQGLCAGGGYVMEFINNALAIYNSHGYQLVAPIGSSSAFLQPPGAPFSDPRCYYDASTQRWFYVEFTFGSTTSSGKVIPSIQYVAVSNSPDPASSYTIWSWNTTDLGQPHCPCYGDYDNFGADANGVYVATDEFPDSGPGYNGAVVYAISKGALETVAQTGITPAVVGYRLPPNAFGQTYIVAPTTTPPGGRFAPGTEYFIESHNANSGHGLMVYAMHDTSQLNLLGTPPPSLFLTEVKTQAYAFPPNAAQKPGPRPLGNAYQAPAGTLQADFDAEMEPTYTNGQLYGQLTTGTSSGTSAADWFILKPKFSGTTLSASLVHQGSVAVKGASLLYPYTAVNAKGDGYLLFSLSGKDNYPSPAYIAYGAKGPTGPVIVATPGAAPEDGFTCYAAFVGPVYGGCRWGDYSAGAVMGGRVYMATEMIPQAYRDLISNWGTYIWSAPAPS